MNATLNANADICRRAIRIVDRVLPIAGSVHGFRDPDGFVKQAMRIGARDRKYREVCKALFAKDARA